jgi:hypothetical protein
MNSKNRELAELLGLTWHEVTDQTMLHDLCSCRDWDCKEINPDFTTDAGKVGLLRLMEKREDWPKVIRIDYITNTTGKLRDAAIEFLKEGRK